jgi:hypothetical protein
MIKWLTALSPNQAALVLIRQPSTARCSHLEKDEADP